MSTMSTTRRMPAIFFGHGSPMNALEDNRYTKVWEDFGKNFPRPKAILAVSAHWTTRGTGVTASQAPVTIHDFGGFPQALFDVRYPAPGDPALARRVAEILSPLPVAMDQQWGLDHGTWSVLVKTYPDADIPVIQLSIDVEKPPAYHFALGQKLQALRDEGVMIIGSGNVVHNLRRLDRDTAGHGWAIRFNNAIRQALQEGDMQTVINYQAFGQDAALSVPTSEHFLPLLYVLGTRTEQDKLEIPVDGIELGAISMLSVVVS
ncbi:4,5-DOPA dioxygenase extradiol [Undibacterium terreum]|uniref:LigB family dioxygenase n=1 Tax=Undibacterium terreum TaxID=1224302 RepID=A0A916UZ31_9BURK|nr:4,5-DOPA dioxygenase extradiol [Undibacterium terreum]GGC95778.1 LigB family dioxygenase [Undibacterium terreum]